MHDVRVYFMHMRIAPFMSSLTLACDYLIAPLYGGPQTFHLRTVASMKLLNCMAKFEEKKNAVCKHTFLVESHDDRAFTPEFEDKQSRYLDLFVCPSAASCP